MYEERNQIEFTQNVLETGHGKEFKKRTSEEEMTKGVTAICSTFLDPYLGRIVVEK